MRLTEHQPPHYQRIPEGDPTIFLDGSTLAVPPWQPDAIETFRAMPDDDYLLHIASSLPGGRKKLAEDDSQFDWKELHLNRAIESGGVLFWFAGQDPAVPAKIALGEVIGLVTSGQDINAVIGFEAGYKGGNEKLIRKRAEQFNIPVVKKLKVACQTLFDLVTEDVE